MPEQQENYGYRHLALAVIGLAFADAKKPYGEDGETARFFLSTNNDMLRLWCEWAELDPMKVIETYQAKALAA